MHLIVIATHGMSSWRHYVHGAVGQRVIHHTPCAVLVARSALNRK
jgi:nucleotide-binding universal stress UspA family protein